MFLEEVALKTGDFRFKLFHDKLLGQNLIVNICSAENWDHFLFVSIEIGFSRSTKLFKLIL